MKAIQKGIIMLVDAALTGQHRILPDGVRLEDLVQIAQRHNIALMAYYGAVNCGIDRSHEQMQRLFQLAAVSMATTEHQKRENMRLLSAFAAAQIDYAQLKGAILRPYYPVTEMRTMGDLDVLIRMEQYEKIQNVMEDLGYHFVREYNHELVWKHNIAEVELHRWLADCDDRLASGYYADGWAFFKQENGRYMMSPEDTCVFLFVHFSKHYRFGGIGIKHLTDLWVYQKGHPNLDQSYIQRELEKIRLDEFYRNVCRTMDAWFAGGPWDPVIWQITTEIIESGQYGLRQKEEAASVLCKGSENIHRARMCYFWNRLFPGFFQMKQTYPLLKRFPVLLPIFWVIRWGRLLIKKPEKLLRLLRKQEGYSTDVLNERKKMLEMVGLEFEKQE